MKKSLLFAVAVICTLIISLPSSAQKEYFSGSWKIDRDKSQIPAYTPLLTKLKVQVKGDSLLTVRVYDGGDGQEYPFDENVTLDGKEYQLTIYDMPRKTKASYTEADGVITVESVTTFDNGSGPEDFVSKETWKTDKENKAFVMAYKNKSSQGEAEGTLLYTREE